MIRYKTIRKAAGAEQIIERSRFISYAKPIETKEEGDRFIASIRSMHRDANHNVPAIVLGDKFQLQWGSDDGEPQGTSGAPIVQMLVKEGITNVVVVVTRYFGGIKLGTGGLVRAYTGSAKLALEAAGICGMKDIDVITVKLEYTYLSKLQNLSKGGKSEGSSKGMSVAFEIKDIVYEDMLTMKLAAEPEEMGNLKDILMDLTGGSVNIIGEEEMLVPWDIGE